MSTRETMLRSHKARSGMALGGIGTGGFELRKDGQFYNWHIFNNTPFGAGPRLPFASDSMLFFLVRYQEKGQHPRIKLLQVDQGDEVANIPSHIYTFPWLSGVDRIDYDASFPFSRLTFRDADMPLVVELEAFTPFIPHDVKNSSLPGAIFNFRVTSTAKRPVDVMLLCSFRNAIGYDVDLKRYASRLKRGRGHVLFEMGAELVPEDQPSWGTQAVASLSDRSTYYLGWDHRHPYYETLIRNPRLPDVDDTEGRNYRKEPGHAKPLARGGMLSSIAASRTLPPGGALDHGFVVAWHCPNLYAGLTAKEKQQGVQRPVRLEGYYSSNFFRSAADVARYIAVNREDLTARTRDFHRNFFDSSADPVLLDQVNSQLNTFVTSAWLTRAKDFGIQEGLTAERSYGPLATIDVAMYGSVCTAALFPELDLQMMRAHKRLQRETGEIAHGIGRNFECHDTQEAVTGRLDLPSQYVILTLRGYFWTGDRAYLREMWPSVKKALDYVLCERDPNGDLLPDMAGSMCTYDNFPMFGAASFVASQWLAALSCAVEAARTLGDADAEAHYADVLRQGRAVFEEKLWNGRYYRLYNDTGGKKGDIDEGCLSDQVIGQWATHLVGLEGILDPRRVRAALRTVLAMAYRKDYGLLNCRWPGDQWIADVPKTCWSDQANTSWTGVELAFASFLIYENMLREGLEIVHNVDRRYRKAGLYWDHQEFGGHYFRPMSAWALVNALLGLTIRDGTYGFAPRLRNRDLRLFFAFGAGTARFERSVRRAGERSRITVLTGRWECRQLALETTGKVRRSVKVSAAGRDIPEGAIRAEWTGQGVSLTFRKPLVLRAGQSCTVTIGA